MESRSPPTTGCEGEADGEDDVGAHVANGAGGEVFEDGAVDVLVAVSLKGRIDAGEGDGGADGVCERAAREGDGPGVGEVGGEAAEGDGEGVEVDLIVVAKERRSRKSLRPWSVSTALRKETPCWRPTVMPLGRARGVFAAAEGRGWCSCCRSGRPELKTESVMTTLRRSTGVPVE